MTDVKDWRDAEIERLNARWDEARAEVDKWFYWACGMVEHPDTPRITPWKGTDLREAISERLIVAAIHRDCAAHPATPARQPRNPHVDSCSCGYCRYLASKIFGGYSG